MIEEYDDITLCTSVIKQTGVVEAVGGQQVPVWDLSSNRDRSSDPDIATVICEICTTPIAKIDLSKMHKPITTDMFLPLDPHHGQMVPFIPGVEFEFMYCPCCRKRFAVIEDRIRTERGFVEVPAIAKKIEKAEKEMKREATTAIYQTDEGLVEVPEKLEKLGKAVHKQILGIMAEEVYGSQGQVSQGDADVACQPHTLDVAGSIPAPATNTAGKNKKQKRVLAKKRVRKNKSTGGKKS